MGLASETIHFIIVYNRIKVKFSDVSLGNLNVNGLKKDCISWLCRDDLAPLIDMIAPQIDMMDGGASDRHDGRWRL